ncbi:MAG TPA: hypothetical protein PKW29_05040 [Clostridia bacterium]|nr:hypothetical protein [Clostridia bacterium]
MADTTMRYMFLRIYSNGELQNALGEMLEKGWVPDRCKGNFLFFRKQRLPDARLMVVSTECSGRTPKGDKQIDEYIEIALRKGWQLLCIGDIESVIPVRRRLFFYTRDPEAAPLEPDEAIDFQYAYRAYHSTLRWAILWTLLAAATLASTILFMRQDGARFVLILIDLALLAISVCSYPLFLSRRTLYRHVTRQAPLPADSHRTLHRRETSLAVALAALLLGVGLLLFL